MNISEPGNCKMSSERFPGSKSSNWKAGAQVNEIRAVVEKSQSTNLVNKTCSMVVSLNPCRRRGGLWWRMEALAAGEENRGEGENRGKGKKKCGEGRRREGRRVFRRVRSRRWECRF